MVLELLRTNGGCQLPCWWGIIPGQTSWEEAQHRLGPLASQIAAQQGDSYAFYYAHIRRPEEITYPQTQILQTYRVEEGVVRTIETTAEGSDYSIQTILATYGSPTEVWIEPLSRFGTHGDPPFTRIILFYASPGFMLLYAIDAERQEDVGVLKACPKLTDFPVLWTWEVGRATTFTDIIGYDVEGVKRYFSLRTATGLSLEEFHAAFSVPGSPACLETPLELESP